MANSNDRDSGEEPQSSPANGPYPWRNSEAESASEPDQEPDANEPTTNPEPPEAERGNRGPPSQPSREQDSGNQGRSPQNQQTRRSPRTTEAKTNSRPQSEPPGVQPVRESEERRENRTETDETEKSLAAKLVLLVVGGLSKLWHAKVLGFYWILPRVTGTTNPQEGLSGHFYPNQMIREDEQVVYSGNPSRWLSPAPYVVSGVLLALAVLITVAVPLGYGEALLDTVTPSVLDLSVPSDWWYAPLLFVAIAALLLIYVVTDRASTWHVITDKRLLHRKNVLAPNRTRLDLVDVKSIDCRQPLPERWYDVGYIDIYTASTGGKEVVLEGVKEADSVAKLIDKARYNYQQRIRGGYPEKGEAPEGESPPRSQEQQGHRQQQQSTHQDPGANRHGERSQQANTPHDEQNRRGRQRRDRSAGGPGEERRTSDSPERRDERGEPFTDPFAEEGDSIEEQRPNHTLRDDLGDTTRRDDS